MVAENGTAVQHALSASHPTVISAIESINKAMQRRTVRNAIIMACEDRLGLRLTLKMSGRNHQVRVQVQMEDDKE